MLRYVIGTLALVGLGQGVRAGELDREVAPKASPAAAVAATAAPATGTELDRESPQSAYRGHGGWGHHGGWGYGGGYRGGFGYGGGWGYRGWGGYGGWGYRPYVYGGYYRPYYGFGYGYGYGIGYGGFYGGYGSYVSVGYSPYGRCGCW